MKKYDSSAIRNVAFMGHGDSGKTALVSAMLFNSGMVNRLGNAQEGTTVTDFSEDEIARQVSISTSMAYAEHNKHKINLIDTPGYANFIHETKAALPVADAAMIVICAVSGVEVMTERVFRYTREQQTPTAFVINKMDRDNASFETALAEIRKVFDRRAIPIQLAIGNEANFKGVVDLVEMKARVAKADGSAEISIEDIPADMLEEAEAAHVALQEMIAENDEELMDHYFEVGELTPDEMRAGLRRAVRKRQLFPVFAASSTQNIGVTAIMNDIVNYMPNPLERKEIAAKNEDGDEIILKTEAGEQFSAYVFKTIFDSFTGRINFFRIFSGTPKSETVYNANSETSEKLGNLLLMQGKESTAITLNDLVCGDIVAVAKLKETHTKDTFCDKAKPFTFKLVEFAEPAIAYALEPKSRGDEEKIGAALTKLMEEDVMLRTERNAETKELLVKGTGQLHIEVVVDRLKNKFNCEVILHPPKVPYRETVTAVADVRTRYKKQSGGSGQFAECAIKLSPNDRDAGYEFLDEIFGGSISQGYRPAVNKGVLESCGSGVVAGYPLVDFKVTLYDGKEHAVDSSEQAFRMAGAMAFKEAAKKAKPVLLEPIMEVEIAIPEANTGDVMGDLSGRRGRPLGMEPSARGSIIKAQVPMAEMLSYAADLTSMTGGRGSFHMELSHYDVVPQNVAQGIIKAANKEEEE
jgi:elongation factor G